MRKSQTQKKKEANKQNEQAITIEQDNIRYKCAAGGPYQRFDLAD